MNLSQQLNNLIEYKRKNASQYDKKVSAYITAEIKLLEKIQSHISAIELEKEKLYKEKLQADEICRRLEYIGYIHGLVPNDFDYYLRWSSSQLKDEVKGRLEECRYKIPEEFKTLLDE